jgi:hypothetical protein
LTHPVSPRQYGGESYEWEFVMRSVFGDESQDETKQRVFSVAGVFGSSEEWDILADRWLRATGGRIFHAADCESDLGEFSKTSHTVDSDDGDG